MARIEQSIEVNAPAPTVYNQLTQFENYPHFMEDIEEVRQLDDTHLHWRAKLNSHNMEWDAEIMEQVPDQLIAWRNMGGPIKAERVEVRSLDQNKAKLTMTTEYEPPQQAQGQEGDLEIKIAEHAVHDLMRLKRFIESRGRETGAWRGEVRQGQEVKPPNEGASVQGGQPTAGAEQGKQTEGGPRPDGPAAGAQPSSEQQPSAQQPGKQAGQQPGKQAGQQPDQQPGQQAGQQPGQQAGQQPSQQAGQQPSQQASQQAGQKAEQQPAQQAGQQSAAAQQAAKQVGGQVGAPQQQPMQGAEPMLTAMTSMNPQSWLPNILHAWEEPFVMMRKMTEDMDQIFERFLGRPMYGARQQQQAAALPSGVTAWSPPMEVAQRDSQLVIRAELPGVKQEDVQVEIKNDRLVIEGDRPEATQREGFRRTERSYGHFYRAIALPEGVDPERASASMRDGVLEVTVPIQQTRQQGRHLDIRPPQ